MNEELLRQMVKKLDQMIILLKLANQDAIDEAWKKINADEVSRELLELADGALDSSELQKRVSEITQKSTRTVQARISELVRQGVLEANHSGNKIYYAGSDLFH